jgi:transposase
MGKQHDIDDAARALGVTPKTLRRWIAEQELNTAPDPDDGRKRLLTQAQVDALRSRYRPVASIASVPSPDPIDHALLVELQAEVKYLKSHIKLLEAQIGNYAPQTRHDAPEMPITASMDFTPYQLPQPRPRTSTLPPSHADTFPVDWLSLDEFVEAHKMSMTTIKDNLKRGDIVCHKKEDAPDPRGWKRGRNWITRAVSPEQRAAILARCPPKQVCDLAGCPCHSGANEA